jgi:hypothetical protein
MEARTNFELWTAWLDYYATGEGRSIMATICYGPSPEQAKEHFGRVFDPYYAVACEVDRGVVRNAVTQLLWSEEALVLIESCNARGVIEAYSSVHFNLA